ncbi:unnamed protein product [Parnassius mnemosyne]|uniref:Reverse transcriptase n=1 Tax=Parnassius mnemosyne TaxID=213953 RepID=A0AAV1MB18_9NEOP
MHERVDAELNAMLPAGVIEPVDSSDWASPLVLLNKPDGSLRICAGYKVTLNRVLLADKFPVLKNEDLLANLSGCTWFSINGIVYHRHADQLRHAFNVAFDDTPIHSEKCRHSSFNPFLDAMSRQNDKPGGVSEQSTGSMEEGAGVQLGTTTSDINNTIQPQSCTPGRTRRYPLRNSKPPIRFPEFD